MGRIKVFFCSFCMDGSSTDQSNHEASFDRNIDVSHLATPHTTAVPTQIQDRSSPLSNRCEDNNEDNYLNFTSQQQRLTQSSSAVSSQQHHQPGQRESNITNHLADRSPYARPPSSLHLDNNSPQPPSSPFSASPVNNIYEPQNERREPSSPESQQRQLPPPRDPTPPPVVPRDPTPTTSSNCPTTKLSYDIISVREPLAKILAERQQLLQSQQQQRQLLGDHDYIEVYGERGSSCFYEEIAGSVTSSATYDQIGTNSNHNYQVLINAYAVANRNPVNNQDESNANLIENGSSTNSNRPGYDQEENAYDVTSNRSDHVDGPPTNARLSLPTASSPSATTSISVNHQEQSTLYQSEDIRKNATLTQSIPVYSVINKATRKSSTIRSIMDNNRPPEPPPKNLLVSHHHHQQQPMSAINLNEPSSFPRTWSPLSQIPSTSSNPDRNVTNTPNESNYNDPFNSSSYHRHARLPQPPPRFSKHSAFNHTTDRPLPSPNGHYDITHNNNNGPMLDRNNITENDDAESIDNGYELLMSNNFEDDQIDVGYEKIKESNRYSGGSISSQFYQRQLIDNGGYESVQPIYSSPSNALVEPNYEAIAPATASGLAAAATAKLNAAASVIEQFLKKD